MRSRGLPSVLVSELVSKIRSATVSKIRSKVADRVLGSQLNTAIICLLSVHKARQRARQHIMSNC